MTRDEAKRVLATVLRYTACDADYAYDKEDGGTELVPGQDIAVAICMALAALNEQEEHRWIPVTERLPDDNGNYIVTACDEGCPYGEGIWYDTVVVVAEYYDGSWTWNDGGAEYDLFGIVTHWMPLPSPPKEV